MGESSSKKRTGSRSITTKKIVEAARSILKKKTPAKRPAKKNVIDTENEVVAVADRTEGSSQHYFGGPIMQKYIEDKRFELPYGYGDNRITIMVRDPYWLHAYWEIPGWKVDELKSLMGLEDFDKSKKILRVYDVTDVNFNGKNANKYFDVQVGEAARSWYINTGESNRSFCVDIGYLTPSGKFFLIARSNIVSTPKDGMSDVIDEEWITIDWETMYALSGGFGIGRSSGEIRELFKKRLKEEMFSGGLMSSWSRNIHEDSQKKKDFWLVVNTELIVYGATEPDAKVTVQGLPIKLRPDGTFTLRFALPDGKQVIPVVAINADGDDKRTITPEVEKKTK